MNLLSIETLMIKCVLIQSEEDAAVVKKSKGNLLSLLEIKFLAFIPRTC